MAYINNFEVWPKIVLADNISTIYIEDKYNQGFIDENNEYEVNYYPLERFSLIGEYKYQEKQTVKPNGNTISITQYFKGEQEHCFEIRDIKTNRTLRINIYSLYSDLFSKRPYKGDMHMHSFYSDGEESPEFVAASCRKIGLDFMAITDHGLYAPSLRAQDSFKDVDMDFLICNGEEVHAENNPVHIINFGGEYSINEKMEYNKEAYLNDVKKIEEHLNDIADNDTRYQYASCIWIFNEIREAKGLGIFCHPYWLVNEGYYISDTIITKMLDEQPYDALELIGGYYRSEVYSNMLQVARYYEERAKGKEIPIVGVSDSHGCQNGNLFGWYYTIVFSDKLDKMCVIDNIKNLYSVAVEALPNETVRVYGPFRLVKYAIFLLREIMPAHDEICDREGRYMLEYIKGNREAFDKLRKSKGSVDKLYKRLWGSIEK